ncbi:MAG: hypothetical protein L0Z62_34185, partial [Gemmataceae bacterium]|nr:hypothetical protein [Gemmataceae bacterium]
MCQFDRHQADGDEDQGGDLGEQGQPGSRARHQDAPAPAASAPGLERHHQGEQAGRQGQVRGRQAGVPQQHRLGGEQGHPQEPTGRPAPPPPQPQATGQQQPPEDKHPRPSYGEPGVELLVQINRPAAQFLPHQQRQSLHGGGQGHGPHD